MMELVRDGVLNAAIVLHALLNFCRIVRMKKFLLIITIICVVTGSSFGATCVGATPCNACKNCHYCHYCHDQGGTCGVCAGHHIQKHSANVHKSKAKVIAQR